MLLVEDVDALHEDLVAKGTRITLKPTNQGWGNREMYVIDPDGNHIRFVQDGGCRTDLRKPDDKREELFLALCLLLLRFICYPLPNPSS